MGDVVTIGDATLYHGDCLEILPTLPKVDAVITDPPYGISDAPLVIDRSKTAKRRGGTNTWHDVSWWDAEINPEWCQAVCRRAPIVAWFGHWRKRLQVESYMIHKIRAEIVWAKDCHVGPPTPLAARDERIWIFSESKVVGATFETSVWDEAIIPTWKIKEHKNEKPEKLMRRLVAWIGASIVLDPFMGSGTTGVACAQLGRKFIGIEIERKHFDIACERIDNAYRQQRLFA